MNGAFGHCPNVVGPNGKVLACGWDSELSVYSMPEGELLDTLTLPGEKGLAQLKVLHFSPDGNLLIAGDSTGVITILGNPNANALPVQDAQNHGGCLASPKHKKWWQFWR
jgi:WD40 repeat protein